MKNVIIIGNGPAGISAALYTTRADITTTIIGKDYGALDKASEIENYYGFSKPISGKTLIEEGIEGARRLGASIISDEVLSLSYTDQINVITKNNIYPGNSIILATGTSRSTEKIPGLHTYEGRGVSFCAVCDGFFYRGKDVGVLGHGNYALHEATALLPIARSVTLLTNGKEPSFTLPNGLHLNKEPIDSIHGNDVLDSVHLQNKTSLSISGLFMAVGVASSTDLAKKIGIETSNNKILVDDTMATNIPGVYAAGDCIGGFLQISKAVYEGAKAGTEVIKYLRKQEKQSA